MCQHWPFILQTIIDLLCKVYYKHSFLCIWNRNMKYISDTRSCVHAVQFHVPLIRPSAFPPNDIISSHRPVARPTLPVVRHKARTEGVNGVHMYRMLLEGGSTLIGPALSLHPTTALQSCVWAACNSISRKEHKMESFVRRD